MNDLDERLSQMVASRESRAPQTPVADFNAIYRAAQRQRTVVRAGTLSAGLVVSGAVVGTVVALQPDEPSVVTPASGSTTGPNIPSKERIGTLLASIPSGYGTTITLRHNAEGFTACDEKGSVAGCEGRQRTVTELGSSQMVRGDIFGLAPAATNDVQAVLDDERELPVKLVSASADAPPNAPRLYLLTAPALKDDKGRRLHSLTLRALDESGKVLDTELVGVEDHPAAPADLPVK